MGYLSSIRNFKPLEKTDYDYIKFLEKSLDEYTSKLFHVKEKLREEINDKNLAQKVIIEEEILLCGLLETSPNLIVIIDKDGIIQIQNQPIGNIRISESFGKSIYDLVDVDERYEFNNFVSNILKDGKREKLTITFSDSTQSISTYEVYCGPLITDRKNIGVILIFSDITDYGVLEKLLVHSHKFLKYTEDLIDVLPELKEFTDGFKKIIDENWFRLQ